MISALLITMLLGADPDFGGAIRAVRRNFIEDGDDRVSATATHRVVSHADGSLELQGRPSLRVSLQSVRRERGQTCSARVLSREVGARTVRLHRACALDESWTNEAAGLEQTFTLQRAPRGLGDLRLRLSIEGAWHHQDAAGQVFGGPGSAEVLRYGNAFVLQGGRRVAILVVHVEGGLELRVPQALLDAPGAFPMVIDPLLSMEQPLDDTNLTPQLLSSLEAQPAIAVDGSGAALVAWTDNRRQMHTDIFGARFDHTHLLDARGLPLVVGPGHQRHPALSWDGTTFLLAWEQELLLSDAGVGGEVFSRTVSPGGDIGPSITRLTAGTQPVLAGVADGGYSVLAWLDDQQDVQVGKVTNGTPLTLYVSPANTAVGGRSTQPALSANARGAFVTWERNGIAARVSAVQGHWVGGPAVLDVSPIAAEAHRPSVALLSTGSEEQAVVFFDEPGLGQPYVGGAVVRGPQVVQLSPFPGSTPAVVRTSEAAGGGALGFVGPDSGVIVRDLDAGSTYSVANNFWGRPSQLSLAAGGGLFAVWIEGAGNDVRGLSLTLPIANTAATPVALSMAAPMQRRPNVAMHGAQGLAVWLDGATTIASAAVQIDADTVRFDVNSPPLVVGAAPLEQVDLAAGPGELYLLTWRQTDPGGAAIYARVINGSSPMTAPIVLSTNAVAGPAVAWDQASGKFLVAWLDQAPLLQRNLVTSAVLPSGMLESPVPRATDLILDADVTCLGTGPCLLAWEVRGTGQPTVNSLVINTPMALQPRVTNGGAEPAVAHDGTNFFLGWRTATGLAFAQVNPTTGELSPVLSPASANSAAQLSLAPARPPIAAWAELGADSSRVRLQPLGQPILEVEQGLFPVVATNDAPGPQGVIVYQRYEADPNIQATRAFGKSFQFGAGLPDGGPPDAGLDAGADAGVDAGVDAGLGDGGTDAGVPDAGLMTFQTSGCGCDSASMGPWLLLALATLGRRRCVE